MNDNAGQPVTIERLKELARAYKRKNHCSHNDALEAVAKQNSFSNWHQAAKGLGQTKSPKKTQQESNDKSVRQETYGDILKSLPQSTNKDLIKLTSALFEDQPKTDYSALTPDEALKQVYKDMESFPGGATAHTVDHVTRNAIMNIIMNSREAGMLDDREFDELVEEVRTADGRKALLARIEQSYGMERQSAAIKASTKGTPKPHFSSSPAEIERFKKDSATGPGKMVEDFFANGHPEAHIKSGILRSKIFEFNWGFVSCSNGMAIWDFYVRDAWIGRNENFFDRFLTAWKSDGEPNLDKAMRSSRGGFYISMDDGISNFSNLSLGCLGEESSVLAARSWIANEFIDGIFPIMVTKALDPNFKFSNDWYTY